MKRKRALESMEDTLRRQEKNRTRMASMRGSETQEQTMERLAIEQNRTRTAGMRASETAHVKLHKKQKNKEAMVNARTRTVPVEGAIVAAFHSEVKLGACTSVLKNVIVLHDRIINSVYIASLYTIIYLELPTRAHLFCRY